MMRLDAAFPALLVLAAISLSPASGLAKPTHTLAHKAPAVVSEPKHVRHKGESPEAAGSRRHSTKQHAAVSKPSHGHAERGSHKVVAPEPQPVSHKSHRARRPVHEAAIEAPRPEPQEQIAALPQKATSEDFLRAASAPVSLVSEIPQPAAGPEAEGKSVISNPAKQVPVVSVIRPAAQKPQLKSVEEAAATPEILPSLYNKRGRLVMPPPLKGSHEILVHQNVVADQDGLGRVQNDEDLMELRERHLLVALPENGGMQVDERLPMNRRYCRPWAAQFLEALGRAHYAHFHTPLQVNSAVRTVEFQQHLIHINGNAAPAEGDTASPHLTGQAIDIAKHGLSATEIAWMRGYLLPLVQEGKIDVEEEFQQSCFHISVYKKYQPAGDGPERDEAGTRRTAALAAAIR